MSKADTRPSVPDKNTASQAPLVIGIGASAGGLEALQQFFDFYSPKADHGGHQFLKYLERISSTGISCPVQIRKAAAP